MPDPEQGGEFSAEIERELARDRVLGQIARTNEAEAAARARGDAEAATALRRELVRLMAMLQSLP